MSESGAPRGNERGSGPGAQAAPRALQDKGSLRGDFVTRGVGTESTQRRFDLNGYPLHEVIHVTRCADCGMGLVSATEFHPYLACEVFRETHSSDRVWEALMALIEEKQRDRR